MSKEIADVCNTRDCKFDVILTVHLC